MRVKANWSENASTAKVTHCTLNNQIWPQLFGFVFIYSLTFNGETGYAELQDVLAVSLRRVAASGLFPTLMETTMVCKIHKHLLGPLGHDYAAGQMAGHHSGVQNI